MEGPTIRELAQHCGLSPSAISAALRNKKNISPETKQRVHQAAQELGYSSDAKLSQLMSYLRSNKGNRTAPSLILLYDSPSPSYIDDRPWLATYTNGVERRCAQFGYIIEKIWARSASTARLNQILQARGVEGVILFQPTDFFPGEFAKDLGKYALCAIEGDHAGRNFPRVVSMGFENVRLAMKKVIELGYERPAMVIGNWVNEINDGLLRAGFIESQWALPASQRIPPLIMDDWHLQLDRWVKKNRPDVLLCGDSNTVKYLKKSGLRVPKDISVVHLNHGHDVQSWAGVDNNHSEIGSAAVDLVVAQIHRGETGLPAHPKSIFLYGVWKDGETCPAKLG